MIACLSIVALAAVSTPFGAPQFGDMRSLTSSLPEFETAIAADFDGDGEGGGG